MVNVPLLINVLEIDIQQAAMTSGLLLSAMTVSMAITAYVGRPAHRTLQLPACHLGWDWRLSWSDLRLMGLVVGGRHALFEG